MTALETYIVTVAHLGLLPALAFPIFYARSDWRATAVGRALMLKGSALASFFLVAVVGFWWPFPGYQAIYAAVVTLVVVGITYQLAVMLRLQRQARSGFARKETE